MKDYYKLYKKSDVTSEDIVNVTDATLRQKKKEVREYVDRLLCPSVFLETEIEGSQFTAAFTDCMDYFRGKRAPNRTMNLLSNHKEMLLASEDPKRRACFIPQFEWDTGKLAEVILRHADMRGNILVGTSGGIDDTSGAPTEELMERYNWYNSWQHAQGGRENDSGVPNEGVMSTIAGELVKFKGTTDEPLTAFDIALLGGLHPRTYAVEVNAKTQRAGGDADYELVFKTDEFFEMCMAYFDTNGAGIEDLGYRIFLTPLVRRSLHTSYLPFRTPLPQSAAKSTNGPPKKQALSTPHVVFGARAVSVLRATGHDDEKDDEATSQKVATAKKRSRPDDFSLEVIPRLSSYFPTLTRGIWGASPLVGVLRVVL